jgi:hypothetical protein
MASQTTRRTSPLWVVLVAALPAVAGASPPAADVGRRLCDALHALPEARKAACCGTAAANGLAAECARELGRSLDAGTLATDPADVDRCVSDSARALDGCGWVTPYLPPIPGACRGILHGRLDAGATCRSSLECRDGLACRGTGPAVAGVCARPGLAGAVCAGAPDTLATYTRQTDDDARHPECAGYCLRGRCAAFLPRGGTCSSNRQCGPGSHCVSRRCVEGPAPVLGEACEGTACAGGFVCVDGRCAEAKQAGERCTRPFECRGACLGTTAGAPGTCGMKCNAWPPAGYTPPLATSAN